MPKIRIEVSKLENPTAEFISLVHRPANRIPFRIIKQHPDQENSMIDLSDVRNVIKSDGAQPKTPQSRGAAAVAKEEPVQQAKLVGLVVEKADVLTEEVKIGLTALGIDAATPVANQDGTVLLDQHNGEGTVVMKLNEHALALLDMDAEAVTKGTDYADLFEEYGVLPSIEEARASLKKSLDRKLASDKPISETVREAHEFDIYSQRLTKAVPESVFKAGALLAKACAKPQGQAAADGVPAKKAEPAPVAKVDCPACSGAKCAACGDGKVTKEEAETLQKAFPFKKPAPAAAPAAAPANTDAEGAGDTNEAGEPPEPKAPAAQASVDPAQAGATAPAGVDQAAWDKMSPDEKAKVLAAAQQPAQKSQEADAAATMQPMDSQVQKTLDTVLATLGSIQKGMTDLAGTVATVAKAQADLATEVAGVKATAKKAEAATQRAVIGGVPQADNEEGKQAVAKSERTALGSLDTAFNPSVRRVNKFEDRVAATRRR